MAILSWRWPVIKHERLLAEALNIDDDETSILFEYSLKHIRKISYRTEVLSVFGNLFFISWSKSELLLLFYYYTLICLLSVQKLRLHTGTGKDSSPPMRGKARWIRNPGSEQDEGERDRVKIDVWVPEGWPVIIKPLWSVCTFPQILLSHAQ